MIAEIAKVANPGSGLERNEAKHFARFPYVLSANYGIRVLATKPWGEMQTATLTSHGKQVWQFQHFGTSSSAYL